LYNNFYDIYDILKEGDNDFKYSINDDKISNLSYRNDSISFYANIKSLDRIMEKMKRKNKTNLSEITDIVRVE
jgi:ppGpp synthetase/RelA/SpoT-type nucleotidyltranferase